MVKHGAHDALAAGIGHELAAVAEQAAAGHGELQAHAIHAGHVVHHAAAAADLLDDRAGIFAGHVADHLLHRLHLVAVLVVLDEHLRLGHLELIALAAHVLNEHGQVQLAAAADAEGIRRVGLLHAQGDVGFQLAHQARAQVAGGDVGALAAGERAVIDGEGHHDGRLGDLDEGQRLHRVRRADGVADHDVLDAGDRHDLTHGRLLNRHALEAVEGEQAAQAEAFAQLRILVVAAGLHGIELHGAAGDAADADAAHELVVVDRGDEHLRRALRIALRGRNVLENRVKQRAQIDARDRGVERRRAGAGAGIDDGGVQLALVRVQIDHQVDGLGDDLVAARVRTVHLVDHGDDRQAQRQRVLEHEAGLGHRALEGVDQQQHAVDHLEHALHLAAEVSVAGGIHDVDLHVLVVDGRVLGQDGDAALLFQIVAVHDAVGDLLVLTENAALLEHFVDQRGLAVVDVRNDGDVADVLTSHFQGERPSFYISRVLTLS